MSALSNWGTMTNSALQIANLDTKYSTCALIYHDCNDVPGNGSACLGA